MRPLRTIFFASFIFSFHLALLSYLNSSVLDASESLFSTAFVYTLGSCAAFLLVVVGPRLARRFGASKFLSTSILLCAVLLCLLSFTIHTRSFGYVFILYFALNTLIWYAFDLVIEHSSRSTVMGNIRGTYLTLNNAGWVLAPMLASVVANSRGFGGTYILASVAVCISFLCIHSMRRIPRSTATPEVPFTAAFRELVSHPTARRIVSLYLVLQFFYAWMVLYLAPYLLHIGFSWGVIGVVLSIMLLPFVLLQYRTGKYADKKHNEATLVRAGLICMSIATFLLAANLPANAALFAGILFLTRVGASIVEVSLESAFFKVVEKKDTALISTIRMTLPVAYIIAPLIGALCFLVFSYQGIFVVLSLILAGSALYAYRLTSH